jgi:hypothetical protein
MKALNVERLNHIVKAIKPYRGSGRYPIGQRTHRTKVFTIDELNGERIYRAYYGYSWDSEFVSKEEYLKNKNINGYNELGWQSDESKRYVRYTSKPFELGIVRPDNTFEFTAESGYGQGHNQIMSAWCRGYIHTSSRHGGMVYRQGSGDDELMHPIFKGLRIDCDTWAVHETSQYKIYGYRVDRKKGNEFLYKYKDFYTICETMMCAMDIKNLMETGIEIAKENGLTLDNYYIQETDKRTLLLTADSKKNITPLDSGILFALAHDVSDFYRKIRYHHNNPNNLGYHNSFTPDNLFANLKRKINKELYRENKSVMKEVEFEAGKAYPPSEWGVRIVDLNGNELKQYC